MMTTVTVTRADGSFYLIRGPAIQRGKLVETLKDGIVPIVIQRGPGCRWNEVETKPIRTTCRRGHVRNGRNTIIDKRGYQRCLICKRNFERISRHRKIAS